jgi:hypothetical protein
MMEVKDEPVCPEALPAGPAEKLVDLSDCTANVLHGSSSIFDEDLW